MIQPYQTNHISVIAGTHVASSALTLSRFHLLIYEHYSFFLNHFVSVTPIVLRIFLMTSDLSAYGLVSVVVDRCWSHAGSCGSMSVDWCLGIRSVEWLLRILVNISWPLFLVKYVTLIVKILLLMMFFRLGIVIPVGCLSCWLPDNVNFV